MNIFAICLVKNEEDVIGFQIEHLIEQGISRILVIDNLSTDNTRAIAEAYSKNFPVTVLTDDEFAYFQARKMNNYISLAYDMGAEFILPIDADEIWYPNDKSKTLALVINEYSGADFVFECQRRNFIPSMRDGQEANPFLRIKHLDSEATVGPKVCFTRDGDARITQGNHDVLNHRGSRIKDLISINHYPYRSFGQFRQKLWNGKNVYQATNLPDSIGRHWRTLGSLSDQQLWEKWTELVSKSTHRLNL